MRLSESIVSPALIIAGWILAVILLGILFRRSEHFENRELTRMATVGAFVLVISSIPIPSPIPIIPIPLHLSGVMLILLIFGVKRGIYVGTAAIVLNHLLIPGSLGALGLNLTNMIVISLSIGYIPHKLMKIENLGRRSHYIISFSSGFLFVVIDMLLAIIEISASHSTNEDLRSYILPLILVILLLALIEGAFTGLTYSYYARSQNKISYGAELRMLYEQGYFEKEFFDEDYEDGEFDVDDLSYEKDEDIDLEED